MTSARLRGGLVAALVCLSLVAAPAALAEEELSSGRFVLTAPDERALLRTGLVVSEGDWLLTPDGAVFRVASLAGPQANLVRSSITEITFRSPISPLAWPARAVWPPSYALAGNRIVVYSTHGDETLRGAVAVAGKASEEAVPVLSVTDSFAAEASTWGLSVKVDTTSHWPHDGDAYRRSALTVRDLLRGRPDMLIDWQTDRAPAPDEPRETPACLLVVGGSTPRLKSNLNFARALMTTANRDQLGTVRGILVARGDYAQVYYPAAVVVLAGTAADDAKSIAALAAAVADSLGSMHSDADRVDGGMTTLYIVTLGLAMLFQRLMRRQWRGRWR